MKIFLKMYKTLITQQAFIKLLRSYGKKASNESLAKRKEKYGKDFPKKLLMKKTKTPPYMYIANENAVKIIDEHITPLLNNTKCDTVLEMNPGIGLFTKFLLNEEKFRNIILIETLEHFMPHLQELHSLYPERVQVQQADIVGLWKIAYQDKMDNGTRLTDLLRHVPHKSFSDEPNMLLFGAVGDYNFFKHLINSIIFQYSLLTLGRCEMYLAVPPPIYIHLTCTNDIGYMIYRSTSILFQIMFEHRFITTLPRDYFLPWQREYTLEKGSKLGRVKSINPECLYLVKIVPRKNFFDLCATEDLPALWYFIKQNCISRRNRVIPNLEKWVPGCGPRLIINKRKQQPVELMYPDENIENLPKFSAPCTTMTNKNFYPDINIYTQVGDLSASQMLSLFCEFRSWPEYTESSFLASLENTLLKLETAGDDSGADITEEDDVSSDSNFVEENYIDDQLIEIDKKKTTKTISKMEI